MNNSHNVYSYIYLFVNSNNIFKVFASAMTRTTSNVRVLLNYTKMTN
jgi:hypothetical protein